MTTVSTDGVPHTDGSSEFELREGRMSERLSVVLAADIVSGRLSPGDPFPSAQQIVNRFGVSRIVAREAVQALEMLSLVRVHHGKRTEVLPASEWAILSQTVQHALRQEHRAGELLAELYDVRLLLEPAAASWMAERGLVEQIQELERIAAQMTTLADEALVVELLVADRSFHDLIAAASGNRILIAVIRDLRELIDNVWGLSAIGPHNAATVAAHHGEIAAAISRRDPALAHEAMTAHLQWASQADVPSLPTRTGPPPGG
jgi:GntR family transcriptional regulator, galactonate operon transcriptional repressor